MELALKERVVAILFFHLLHLLAAGGVAAAAHLETVEQVALVAALAQIYLAQEQVVRQVLLHLQFKVLRVEMLLLLAH
jgi:hypothetical protein